MSYKVTLSTMPTSKKKIKPTQTPSTPSEETRHTKWKGGDYQEKKTKGNQSKLLSHIVKQKHTTQPTTQPQQ